MMHVVGFKINSITKEWLAQCSCGWRDCGTEEQVRCSAATHDLDEPQETVMRASADHSE